MILARLHERKTIRKVNEYLLSAKPWGKTGTDWPWNQPGDYDFETIILAVILHMYGDDRSRMKKQTTQHILYTLLPYTKDRPAIKIPNTFIVPETENHIFMSEGAKYLKYQYIQQHGGKKNPLEKWMVGLLASKREYGLQEFNSMPYMGYTLTALLALEAFGSKPVSSEANLLLEELNTIYAYGSLGLMHFPPFRRRDEYLGMTNLVADYHTSMMRVWTGDDSYPEKGREHALMAAIMPYRPSKKVLSLVKKKKKDYFIKIGHGKRSCPEIYSGGPGYLFTAGGVQVNTVIPRPITLFLEDQGTLLKKVFHIPFPNYSYRRVNLTGVHERFAVGPYPVHDPEPDRPRHKKSPWEVIPYGKFNVCIHSRRDLGIIYLDIGTHPKLLLKKLLDDNGDPNKLQHQFKRPDGKVIKYEVYAHKMNWVIKEGDRSFENWPYFKDRL